MDLNRALQIVQTPFPGNLQSLYSLICQNSTECLISMNTSAHLKLVFVCIICY